MTYPGFDFLWTCFGVFMSLRTVLKFSRQQATMTETPVATNEFQPR